MFLTVVMYTLHVQKCVREIFERMFILKAIAKAYNGVSLILRIVIGLAIGVALALLIPDAKNNAEWIGIFGDLFVGALKAIAPVLVFVLVVSALAQSNEKLGKQFRSVVILYLISTSRLRPLIWKSPKPIITLPSSAMPQPTSAAGRKWDLRSTRSSTMENSGCKHTITVELAMEV